MTLALHFTNMITERDRYLLEMEKGLKPSTKDTNSAGFPYASNAGTHYGDGLLWNSADKEIAISGGAWYIFTKRKFSPFAVGRNKNTPREDMFWMD